MLYLLTPPSLLNKDLPTGPRPRVVVANSPAFCSDPRLFCILIRTGALVLHRKLVANCAVPDGDDRHDPHPQPAPGHYALQSRADGRREGGGTGGDRLEGRGRRGFLFLFCLFMLMFRCDEALGIVGSILSATPVWGIWECR